MVLAQAAEEVFQQSMQPLVQAKLRLFGQPTKRVLQRQPEAQPMELVIVHLLKHVRIHQVIPSQELLHVRAITTIHTEVPVPVLRTLSLQPELKVPATEVPIILVRHTKEDQAAVQDHIVLRAVVHPLTVRQAVALHPTVHQAEVRQATGHQVVVQADLHTLVVEVHQEAPEEAEAVDAANESVQIVKA